MISNRRYYYINSRDRTSGTESDFTAEMLLPSSDQPLTHCVVTDVMIPKSYYLISAGRNTFELIEDGVVTTITVPEGNYSYSTFKVKIAALLNSSTAAGLIYDVETPGRNEPVTGKFTFWVTGEAKEVSFRFGDKDLFERFGFNRNSTNTFLPDAPGQMYLKSTNVVKFDLEDTLYIRSNLTHNGSDNILQQVYVNVEDFGSIHYQCPDILLHTKPLVSVADNSYRFTLTDEDGKVVDLNGLNINMTIMLFRMIDSRAQ